MRIRSQESEVRSQNGGGRFGNVSGFASLANAFGEIGWNGGAK